MFVELPVSIKIFFTKQPSIFNDITKGMSYQEILAESTFCSLSPFILQMDEMSRNHAKHLSLQLLKGRILL